MPLHHRQRPTSQIYVCMDPPLLFSAGSAEFWYKITTDGDGYCLDLRGYDTTPGAQVWLYKCNTEVSFAVNPNKWLNRMDHISGHALPLLFYLAPCLIDIYPHLHADQPSLGFRPQRHQCRRLHHPPLPVALHVSKLLVPGGKGPDRTVPSTHAPSLSHVDVRELLIKLFINYNDFLTWAFFLVPGQARVAQDHGLRRRLVWAAGL